MKKNIFTIVSLCMLCLCLTGCSNQDNKIKRYDEILESFEAGVDWNIKATNPNGCSYKGHDNVTISYRTRITSDILIESGYINKSDMLDIDKKSYCTAYANTDCDGDNIVYKTYLKCKHFTTEGYVEW